MRVASLIVLALFASAVAGASDAMAACSCPKEAMIKKHGTVSALEPSPQVPAVEATGSAEPETTAKAAVDDNSAESLDRATGTGYSPDPELQ